MFAPNENRYEKMVYNRLGNSGLKVSAVSLGLWQNFGFGSDFATAEEMVHTAFDLALLILTLPTITDILTTEVRKKTSARFSTVV